MQNPPPDQQDYGYSSPYSTPPPNAPLVTPPGRGPGGKSSTGLDANIAALLSYLLTWITGLIFFLIEKENRFVRFHAMQAILFGAAIFVISIVLSITLGVVSYVSWILGSLFSLAWLLLWLAFLVGWILCMIKAYQGQMFKLPIVGDMAEKIVNK